jgi:nucleotide-binding universal stress UspA family protein
MNEGSEGHYDAVVLGKRGLSWLEECFDESVSKGFLETECHFPVWFCRHPDPEKKNVLVGIDGSEASYRMTDHIGFVLSGEKSHKITLLLIKKGSTKDNEIENIFSKSKAHLSGNGFPVELIKTQVIESEDVAKTIIKEADKSNYATVALGRTGTGKGFIDRLFMGSVSEAVFKSLNHSALWLCY